MPALAHVLSGKPDYEVTGGEVLLDGEDLAARLSRVGHLTVAQTLMAARFLRDEP